MTREVEDYSSNTDAEQGWTYVVADETCVTTRLCVPGGWIYRDKNAMCFVPYPESFIPGYQHRENTRKVEL